MNLLGLPVCILYGHSKEEWGLSTPAYSVPLCKRCHRETGKRVYSESCTGISGTLGEILTISTAYSYCQSQKELFDKRLLPRKVCEFIAFGTRFQRSRE